MLQQECAWQQQQQQCCWLPRQQQQQQQQQWQPLYIWYSTAPLQACAILQAHEHTGANGQDSSCYFAHHSLLRSACIVTLILPTTVASLHTKKHYRPHAPVEHHRPHDVLYCCCPLLLQSLLQYGQTVTWHCSTSMATCMRQ
jgi:hypothetical protein